MENYNQALQKLSATIKARETFFKSFKDAPNKFNGYDRMITRATKNYINAYRQLVEKNSDAEVDKND